MPDEAPGTWEARPASYARRVDDDPSDAAADADARPGGASSLREDRAPGPLRARRRPRPIGAAALVLVALVAAGVAVQQRTVADAWRDRAERLEVERDEAIGRSEALRSQLDELAAVQASSEGELAALTERLADLAGEKAQAEDRTALTEAERDAVRRVAQRVADAVSGLDACILALLEVRASSVDAFNRLARGEFVDVDPLNAQSAATIEQCDAARRAAAAAGSAAGALG